MPIFPDVDASSANVDGARTVCHSLYQLLARGTQFLTDRSLLLLRTGPSLPSLWAALLPT